MFEVRWDFNDRFIANLLGNIPVKEFLKLVNIWLRHDQENSVSVFCARQLCCKRAYAIAIPSVRPSVRPSHG